LTPALLALEDGTIFKGRGFGATTTITGEVCFNTGMTGYQEVLTDPSYHGQIVAMTSAEIGNTGVNSFDEQSVKPWVAGFAVRDLAVRPSSWRSEASLEDYLQRHRIPGISDIDTRKLTRHIRTHGALRGALSTEATNPSELVDRARSSPSMVGLDLASEVTTGESYVWDLARVEERARTGYAAGSEISATSAALLDIASDARFNIVAFDYGIKRNILDLLVASGCEVTVVPATTSADDILAGQWDGVFLSNGPGDPEPVTFAIDTVASLVGRIPVFGICLGHQILGLALGGRTFKLPFGHRGSNHPVKRVDDPRIEITCQNHGFAVDPASLDATPARLTHVNLNDQTVEGLSVDGVAYSVQYHPESGPGPHDSRYLFQGFRDLMQKFEPSEIDIRPTVST
jgi:carbamoyl-phosphate synthase small subunit